MPDTDDVAKALAKYFIARKDVKAQQDRKGAYRPVTDTGKTDGEKLPWTMGDLRAHVSGEKTFGHYVVSKDNTAKVFCFDIDLESKVKVEIEDTESVRIEDDRGYRRPRWSVLANGKEFARSGDARALWKPMALWQNCHTCKKGWYVDFQEAKCGDMAHHHELFVGGNPDTAALTTMLQATAFRLADGIKNLLDVPVAVAYSGNKGIHVYGLVGEAPAADVRLGANMVLESFSDRYVSSKGNNFFRSTDPDEDAISIEVFPKQDSLEGKDLGNLIRLPVGVNQKSGNKAFFLKYGPFGYVSPADPLEALAAGDPWDESLTDGDV